MRKYNFLCNKSFSRRKQRNKFEKQMLKNIKNVQNNFSDLTKLFARMHGRFGGSKQTSRIFHSKAILILIPSRGNFLIFFNFQIFSLLESRGWECPAAKKCVVGFNLLNQPYTSVQTFFAKSGKL